MVLILTGCSGCADKSADQWYNHLNPFYHGSEVPVWVFADKSEWVEMGRTSNGRVSLYNVSTGKSVDMAPDVLRMIARKK